MSNSGDTFTQTVISRFLLHGQSSRELGEVFGLSHTTILKILHTGMKKYPTQADAIRQELNYHKETAWHYMHQSKI